MGSSGPVGRTLRGGKGGRSEINQIVAGTGPGSSQGASSQGLIAGKAGSLVPGIAATEQEKIQSLVAAAGASDFDYNSAGGNKRRRGAAIAAAAAAAAAASTEPANIPGQSASSPMPPPHLMFGAALKVPPPNYVCHKCGGKDHFIQQCPTVTSRQLEAVPVIRRTTGIPKTFLKTIAPEDIGTLGADQGVMVTDEGKLVIVQKNTMDWERINALNKKGTLEDMRAILAKKGAKTMAKLIPSHLKCGLCMGLLDEAVIISCCESFFCDECKIK